MNSDPPEEKTFILTLESLSTKEAKLTTLSGETVEVEFGDRFSFYLAKDLGRWARRNLGLSGRTDPGEFTQIVWQDRVLSINQPLAVLLPEENRVHQWAQNQCTFCAMPLRNCMHLYVPYKVPTGPFYCCLFCGDQPSWHHGWCCPQNPDSSSYTGPTHADRTSDMYEERMAQARQANVL